MKFNSRIVRTFYWIPLCLWSSNCQVAGEPALLTPNAALGLFVQGAVLRFSVPEGACSADPSWPLFPFGDQIASGFISYYDDQCWVFNYGINRLVDNQAFNASGLVTVQGQSYVYDSWKVVFLLTALDSQKKTLASGSVWCNITANNTAGVRLTTDTTPATLLDSAQAVRAALDVGYSLSFSVNLENCLLGRGRLDICRTRIDPVGHRVKAGGQGGGYIALVGQVTGYSVGSDGSIRFVETTQQSAGTVEVYDVIIALNNNVTIYVTSISGGEFLSKTPVKITDTPPTYVCSLTQQDSFKVYVR